MSEGRDEGVLDALRECAGDVLADTHTDPDHHRSVLTLLGPPDALINAVVAIAKVARTRIDLSQHTGVHPRIGSLDVVPFAPLCEGPLELAVQARELALSALGGLGLPCFRFGPLPDGGTRPLPEVRRNAFAALAPDAGPATPDRTAGGVAVGAREPLLAWNLWLEGVDLATTREVAVTIRGPMLRALGFAVRDATQVSCNLLDPGRVTPLDVYDAVAARLPPGGRVTRCELVGLVPDVVLSVVPRAKWAVLDLCEERAIEQVWAERHASPATKVVS